MFHGTTLTRAGAIFRAGILRADAPRLWPGTTPGAVYVSMSLPEAADYAKRAVLQEAHHAGERLSRATSWWACVFALIVPTVLLEPDPDDERYDAEWSGTPNDARPVLSRRVPSDVPLNTTTRWMLINAARRAWPADPVVWPWWPVIAGKDDSPFPPGLTVPPR